jgi:RNA polymerase sigma factor (sigma-70 family)
VAGHVHTLFEREHHGLERSLARLVNTSPENLEDALAFAWCALVRRQHRVELKGARAWLLAVARHEAFRLHRNSCRTLPIHGEDGEPLELEDRRHDVEHWDEWRDAAAALRAARLTDRQRRTLALNIAGFSYEEIAHELAASVRTVDRQLQRARRRLAAACGSQAA